MSMVQINFFSESLMRTVNIAGIVPIDKRSVDGQLVRGKQPFNTLYLLHGVYGSELDWLTNTRIRRLAQDWNLAVFMPAGENKFYSDNIPTHDLFGKFVGEELISFTRTMFRLSENREDTYVAGLSMGGLGAILTGLRYPKTFSHIGTFSGAFVTENYPEDDSYPVTIHKRTFYEAISGVEKDYAGSRNDYRYLARVLAEADEDMPKIYMSCGTADFLYPAYEDFKKMTIERGYDDIIFEEEDGYSHEWRFWGIYIERVLNRFISDDRQGVAF